MTHPNNIIKIKREVLLEVIASAFATGVRLSWLGIVDKRDWEDKKNWEDKTKNYAEIVVQEMEKQNENRI